MRAQTYPSIFLDRDGTIIEDRGHLSHTSQVVLIPGAIEALKRLQQRFKLFIVTNQSGVSHGYISRAHAREINGFVVEILRNEGIRIEEVYTCFHCREDNCECIKPKPYFLYQARDMYGIDLTQSYSIGDHPHDVAFAEAAGGKGIYVLTGHGEEHREELQEGALICQDISDAAAMILDRL